MNEKKGSPIATIKGIFGSSKILFICIVYTIAVIGNVVQKFEDRIDFEGMEFFGISLSEIVGPELVGMLQTVSNVLFAISLISLMPMVLMAVGYWLIKKGAGEGNGNTRCALIALDFFKYNLLYQAFMKISLAFGALVLGLFGAIFVLVLFAYLLYRLAVIAQNALDRQGSLIACGIMVRENAIYWRK